MSNTFKLRSTSISKLNEFLQKVTISEGAQIAQNPLLEADGKFTSIINMDNEFNPNSIDHDEIDVEEEKNEEKLQKKAGLVDEVKSKLKQALENNKEITNLLKRIEKINDDTKVNEWELNEIGNTAFLKGANAQIFKQNDNLCLSIKDDVHLFNSVAELHDWLNTHGYPVPQGIKLSESALKENTPRVNLAIQPDEVKEIISRANQGFSSAEAKGIIDVNTILSDVFEPGSVPQLHADEEENEVEECTTTGDIGMTVQYTGDKKDESTLEEDWYAPEIFGLVDDKGARLAFKNIIDGSRAVCKALANDTAISDKPEETIELTQEELDHWTKMAGEMEYVIAFAIPVICKKMANDYVNESIEKNNKRGLIADDQLIPMIKKNVSEVFGYELSDEQVNAMLKRNSKGKDVSLLDPASVRTEDEERIVTETKKAMGQAKEARETVADEIFNKYSLEGRKGYAKYKKFASLVAKKGAIKIVKVHSAPVEEPVQEPEKKPMRDPVEVIYSQLLKGDIAKAKNTISGLGPEEKANVKAGLIAKNPRIEKMVNNVFGESVTSFGEAVLASLGI